MVMMLGANKSASRLVAEPYGYYLVGRGRGWSRTALIPLSRTEISPSSVDCVSDVAIGREYH